MSVRIRHFPRRKKSEKINDGRVRQQARWESVHRQSTGGRPAVDSDAD
jgi:hypothetical protein